MCGSHRPKVSEFSENANPMIWDANGLCALRSIDCSCRELYNFSLRRAHWPTSNISMSNIVTHYLPDLISEALTPKRAILTVPTLREHRRVMTNRLIVQSRSRGVHFSCVCVCLHFSNVSNSSALLLLRSARGTNRFTRSLATGLPGRCGHEHYYGRACAWVSQDARLSFLFHSCIRSFIKKPSKWVAREKTSELEIFSMKSRMFPLNGRKRSRIR